MKGRWLRLRRRRPSEVPSIRAAAWILRSVPTLVANPNGLVVVSLAAGTEVVVEMSSEVKVVLEDGPVGAVEYEISRKTECCVRACANTRHM
jgi:hypothetical protein